MSVAVLDSFKAFGRQISRVRTLNGQYKCAKLKQEYNRAVASYGGQRHTRADLRAVLAVVSEQQHRRGGGN
jgi:hypothetical protein